MYAKRQVLKLNIRGSTVVASHRQSVHVFPYNIVKLATWNGSFIFPLLCEVRHCIVNPFLVGFARNTNAHKVTCRYMGLEEKPNRVTGRVVARDGREAQSLSKDCALINLGSSIMTSIHLRSHAGLASAGGIRQ